MPDGSDAGLKPRATQQEDSVARTFGSASSDEIARRAAAVEQREQAVRARERELADQRRVLAEEYRLLHARRAAAAAETVPSMRVQVDSRPAAAMFEARGDGFWAKVRRAVLGDSHPTVRREIGS
jgi:hypothetical protein